MNTFKFDIFFNHNAEDLYLVQYISQAMRDAGFSTFDRSVDALPDSPADAISEDDALDQSMVMVDVLTENSLTDPSVQQLAARAVAARKPVIVLNYTTEPVPDNLKSYPEVKVERADTDGASRAIERILKEAMNLAQ